MGERVTAVQASVLQWARQSQGFSIDDVAKRMKRNPEEITAWEAGESAPTYAQLETLAYKIYKRPLRCFFYRHHRRNLSPKENFGPCQASTWRI